MATKLRKVTVNLPADLLDDAVRITAKGITSTIVEGLHELKRRERRSALRQLRGKVRFELDLATTRRGSTISSSTTKWRSVVPS